jgi:16S rRNA (guanine966-N2)-methyltransferase
MLRISGGALRGKKLSGPEGLEFRPTTGQVKEFVFFVYRREIENSRFLDLFAGTGSLGLEALSRGAREGFFVEKSPRALHLLNNNFTACGVTGSAHILAGDVFSVLDQLGKRGESFDLIFADPPFKESLRSRIVEGVHRNAILKPGGILILEHESRDADSEQPGLALLRQKKFGHCMVSIYGHGSEA